MIKKTAKICAIIVCSLLLLTAAGYIALGYYYSPYFVFGTWINDYYCTGLDVHTVNQALTEAYGDYELCIDEKNGRQETITGEQIHYQIDFTKSLNEIKQKQNPFNWGYYYFHPIHQTISPDITYDQELLKAAVDELDCSHLEALNQNNSPRIIKQSGEYVLSDTRIEVTDHEKLLQLAINAADQNQSRISLEDHQCYYMPKLQPDEEETYEIWAMIDKVQKAEIHYQDGAQELLLDGRGISKWIITDESGSFQLENHQLTFDQEQIKDYIQEVSNVFNTKGNVRTWTRQDGKVITITSKGKGYIVDEEAELSEISYALETGSRITRKPVYAQTGEPREAIDMGKTYIEVDMAAQKLYYYMNDKLKLSSDVVTGNTSRRHDTPEALCEIYYMQKNRTLHGADYESFVYYWMAVKGHIGIHDATWRDQFGGDIYQTAGSHGCINLPKNKAAELYDMVKVGIPVIIHN
ncbi:MAG: L,D-transpeptidase family protein [bacterium]|nr:L,D-transpeptidase family protein [bacterium]